ncbi:Oidioi.mRNA.OKI2018_I69.chr1.g3665.t1.cds [Oikopleura dioica]|uniref:Oidioi.mRNA.OKI2018_I69.chr1.g3665.t1.cds n=1 Tax=Oikopleura dioica TaxID=34765 RepID=A0ABN7T424_OIKDI|nr:Oidioi.mRNA.OKI2018_I69.chr1.g3665.t1.cds [Oikopleura dioica]
MSSRKRKNRGQESDQDEETMRSQFKSFSHFRKDGILTDVVIAVPGHPEIKAHKMVLAAASPFFEAMFKSGLRESSSDRVEMPEIDYEAAQILVDYAYCGNYKITKENVKNLLAAANCYQFEEIKEKCARFLVDTIDENNCFELEKIGRAMGLFSLSNPAGCFALQNIEKIIKSESFTALSFEEVDKYFSAHYLFAYSEEIVYEGVLTWIKFDLKERSKYASKLFVDHVRVGQIDKNFICDVIEKEPLFSDADCSKHILLAWKFKAFWRSDSCIPSDLRDEFERMGKSRFPNDVY